MMLSVDVGGELSSVLNGFMVIEHLHVLLGC